MEDDVRGFLVSTAVTAVAFFILVKLFPSMFGYTGELIGLVAIAVIFGIVNGLIGPIVRLLALPVRLMTLGLVGFVINGALLLLTAWIVGEGPTVGGHASVITEVEGSAYRTGESMFSLDPRDPLGTGFLLR